MLIASSHLGARLFRIFYGLPPPYRATIHTFRFMCDTLEAIAGQQTLYAHSACEISDVCHFNLARRTVSRTYKTVQRFNPTLGGPKSFDAFYWLSFTQSTRVRVFVHIYTRLFGTKKHTHTHASDISFFLLQNFSHFSLELVRDATTDGGWRSLFRAWTRSMESCLSGMLVCTIFIIPMCTRSVNFSRPRSRLLFVYFVRIDGNNTMAR